MGHRRPRVGRGGLREALDLLNESMTLARRAASAGGTPGCWRHWRRPTSTSGCWTRRGQALGLRSRSRRRWRTGAGSSGSALAHASACSGMTSQVAGPLGRGRSGGGVHPSVPGFSARSSRRAARRRRARSRPPEMLDSDSGRRSRMAGAMSELPTGTVTFLFTDVEGSTRLLQELGAEVRGRAGQAPPRAPAGVRRKGGIEVDTQGDAFFLAFADRRRRPRGRGRPRARRRPDPCAAGLHTGSPLVTEEGYVGRTSTVGRGSLPQATAGRSSFGDDGRPVDGKCTARPRRAASQGSRRPIGVPARRRRVPAAPELYRTNLPTRPRPSSDASGARKDADLLGATSPVTFTGPGGTGKTRLALQVAAEAADSFPDGVWWVPLAPIHDPRLVVTSLAQALGVEGQPGQELGEVIADRLSRKASAHPPRQR